MDYNLFNLFRLTTFAVETAYKLLYYHRTMSWNTKIR